MFFVFPLAVEEKFVYFFRDDGEIIMFAFLSNRIRNNKHLYMIFMLFAAHFFAHICEAADFAIQVNNIKQTQEKPHAI